MSAKIIDGTLIAQQVRVELKQQIEDLKSRGVVPGLAVILVGDNPASISYVTGKERASNEIGMFLHMIGDFERISDHAVNLTEVAQEMHDKKLSFSEATFTMI